MICFIAMLIMFIVHVQILVTFNQRKLTVQGKDSGSSAYMDIDAREGSTSSWQKRDDYLIYHPNQHNMEMPLNHGENVTIGLIFYCQKELERYYSGL